MNGKHIVHESFRKRWLHNSHVIFLHKAYCRRGLKCSRKNAFVASKKLRNRPWLRKSPFRLRNWQSEGENGSKPNSAIVVFQEVALTFVWSLDKKPIEQNLHRAYRSHFFLFLVRLVPPPPPASTRIIFYTPFSTTSDILLIAFADKNFAMKIHHLRVIHLEGVETKPLITSVRDLVVQVWSYWAAKEESTTKTRLISTSFWLLKELRQVRFASAPTSYLLYTPLCPSNWGKWYHKLTHPLSKCKRRSH